MSAAEKPGKDDNALYDDVTAPASKKRRSEKRSGIIRDYLPWTFVPPIAGFVGVLVLQFLLFSPGGGGPAPAADAGAGGSDPLFYIMAGLAVLPAVIIFSLLPLLYMRQALADNALNIRVYSDRILIPPTELGGKKCTGVAPEDIGKAYWNPKGENILLAFRQTRKGRLFRPLEIKKAYITDRQAFWNALKRVVAADEERTVTAKDIMGPLDEERRGQAVEWVAGPCKLVYASGKGDKEEKGENEGETKEGARTGVGAEAKDGAKVGAIEEATVVGDGEAVGSGAAGADKAPPEAPGRDVRESTPASFMASPPEGPGIS